MIKLSLNVEVSLSKIFLGLAGVSVAVGAFHYFSKKKNKQACLKNDKTAFNLEETRKYVAKKPINTVKCVNKDTKNKNSKKSQEVLRVNKDKNCCKYDLKSASNDICSTIDDYQNKSNCGNNKSGYAFPTTSDRTTLGNNDEIFLVGTAEELINDKNSSEAALLDKKSQKAESENFEAQFLGHIPTQVDSKSSKNGEEVKSEKSPKKTNPVPCRKKDLNGVQTSIKDIKALSANKVFANDENEVKEHLKKHDKIENNKPVDFLSNKMIASISSCSDSSQYIKGLKKDIQKVYNQFKEDQKVNRPGVPYKNIYDTAKKRLKVIDEKGTSNIIKEMYKMEKVNWKNIVHCLGINGFSNSKDNCEQPFYKENFEMIGSLFASVIVAADTFQILFAQLSGLLKCQKNIKQNDMSIIKTKINKDFKILQKCFDKVCNILSKLEYANPYDSYLLKFISKNQKKVMN